MKQVIFCYLKFIFFTAFSLLIFFVPHPLSSTPLTCTTALDDYLVDQWNQKRNFPANKVNRIVQTPDGYLWFATDRGVVRYDGSRFEVIPFETESNRTAAGIKTLTVDKNGKLWAASRWGVISFNKETQQMRLLSEKDGFEPLYVSSLLGDSYGKLWIGTLGKGLFQWDGSKLKQMTLNDSSRARNIHSISEGVKGEIWVCAYNDGLFTGRDERFVQYDLTGLEKHTIPYWVYTGIDNELWLGTDHGLVRFIGGKKEKIFTTADGLMDNTVSTGYVVDRDRHFWIITSRGLNRIQRDSVGRFYVKDTSKQKRYSCIFQDREKNLWLGTKGAGLIQLRDTTFKILGNNQGLSSYMNSLYRGKDQKLWIGSALGELSVMENGVLLQVLKLESTGENGITAIVEDQQGAIWLGTEGQGVYRLKNKQITHYTKADGLSCNFTLFLYCDSKNRIWQGTVNSGLNCLSDGTIRSYTVNDGLLSNTVTTVIEDRHHNILIGTSEGINVLQRGQWDGSAILSYLEGMEVQGIYLEKIDEEKAASPKLAGSNHSEKAILWVSTNGHGLIRLEKPSGRITAFSEAEGLGCKSVGTIMEDRWENFWIICKKGLLRVAKMQLNSYAAGEIEKINVGAYDMGDGLPSLNIRRHSRNASARTANGELWFSTSEGIAAVEPATIKINTVPPPVVLKEVVTNHKTVSPYRSNPQFKGVDHLLFRFVAPSFVSPRKVMMKYRLEGYDRAWRTVESGGVPNAHYTDLPAGDYTFRVIAANNSGIWNNDGVSYSFRLVPYFYQTWLFKIGMLIFLGSCMVLGTIWVRHYLYLRKMQNKYRNSALDPDKAEKTMRKLMKLLETEKVYRDENLTLNDLAQKLTIAPRYLSQIVNERMNKNFRDLINGYRVEEAKSMLVGQEKSDQSILAIAYEVGFNSKEAFYRVFKRITGTTPRQFQKQHTGTA